MVDGYSDFDGEVSTTTTLAAPQNPSTTVNTDSITVAADSVSGADGYRFYRAQSSGSVLGDYSEVGDETTPSFEDTGVEDGEKYYYRVTAYTTDTESDPSSEVNAVAFLPAPTVTLSENDPNGVVVEWTKEDDSTDGDWRVDRRPDGASAWTTIANPALGDRSYTDTGVAAGTYEYRVARVTDHDEATTIASITIGVASDAQGFVVGSGSDAVQFDPGNLVAKDLEKIPTGIGTARVDVPETDSLIANVQRHDRADYYVDGTCVFTGYAVGFAGNDRTGRWTVRVDGIGKRLEETRPNYDSLGGSLTYTNIALEDALRDYWPRTPFDATVTDEPETTVQTGVLLQDADTDTEWGNVSSLSDSQPFYVSGGELRLAQSCFTTEGENFDRGSDFGTDDPSDTSVYSGGDLANLSRDSAVSGGPDNVEYDFSLDYTVPASEFKFQWRFAVDGSNGSPAVDVTLQHANGSTYTLANVTKGYTQNLQWTESSIFNGYGGPDLTAGDYTIWFEVTDSDGTGSDYNMYVDVIAPYDNRYSYTFDNDNGGSSGYLDGPELYPTASEVELDTVDTSLNIGASNLDATLNDTSGGQALAVSNDDGATYTTASNTQTLDHNYSSGGRQGRVRFTLDRYGSRTTATPQQGFNGQAVDSFTHNVDYTDLTVIVELELSRNHFSNLKKLHNYGDYLWTIEHDDNTTLSNLTVNSYPRGEITRTTPTAFQDPENRNPEVAAETYFNTVYLQGRLRDDGTRPTADVSDSAAVSSDGREISPGVLRDPSIGTAAGAEFRANALLDTALNNSDLRGTITTFPTFVQPGYDYEIDFGDGAAFRTLERINIRESAGQIGGTYQFVVREALAETINALKSNERDLGDQV